MYYRPKKFTAKELFHPSLLERYGEENCWRRMDAGLLHDIDLVRVLWDDIIYVNLDPHFNRGMRSPWTKTGASWSTHKMGKGTDLVPGNGKYREFWNFVKGLVESGKLKYINVMEDFAMTPTWCHVAIMNIEDKLLIIQP